MGIKLGNLDISSFKVGSGDCTIYLGETLLYSGDTPTPPTPSYKFYAEYSDSTSYSAECDSDTTLTSATTKPSGYDYSNMTDAVIGDCITSIGNNAFDKCSGLTNVTIGNSVTTIGDSAFQSCSGLTSVTIPSSVTSISSNAFHWCENLSSIDFTLPSSISSIGSSAFAICISLTSITIPDSVTNIGDRAFHDCNSLTGVTIGNSVTTIDQFAFYFCISLTSVTVNAATPPTLGYAAFADTNNCPIYVPAESVETYKAASGWSDYASRIQAIP